MSVLDAIREAEPLLPGVPVEGGVDPRWQAIIAIGEYVQFDPDPVWEFILRWASHPQDDLRNAIATCLLEHLLEYHFSMYFPLVEQAALADSAFADTFQRCWGFGQAEGGDAARRFRALMERLA